MGKSINKYPFSVNYLLLFFTFILLTNTSFNTTFAQPQVMAWGNIEGIRYKGELIRFESSISVIGEYLSDVNKTAKERQKPYYSLEGNKEIITTELEDYSIREVIIGKGNGNAEINIKVISPGDTNSTTGIFFCVELPAHEFTGAEFTLIDSTASELDTLYPNEIARQWGSNFVTQAKAIGANVVSDKRELEIKTDEPVEVIIEPGNPRWGNPDSKIYFGIITEDLSKPDTVEKNFSLKVSGKINNKPVEIAVDVNNPGPRFDGVGGNFRLQNPELDPKVINYNLNNLNVTWGRVEMPWSSWHPIESVNPIEAAEKGNINYRVLEAMTMAQRLSKMGMPVIVSAWFAPQWAIIPGTTNREAGLYGDPLNPGKMRSIIKSIGSYLIYLKNEYGVEADMFSFNESDLGIDVRQTPEEHADLIKTLGSYFAENGLATKMLLGDNSDANTYEFVTPALNDPETHKYIGGLSFHSWRGYDNWTLSIWDDIAEELNVPLFIGEGSTDAAAYRYPEIFRQPVYALNEIDVYIRSCGVAQIRAVLQWQLTSDYSVLTGGGVYGTKGELRPTQRFWNLKQLGLTPEGSFHLPVKLNGADISAAAFGDILNGVYSFHLVNNGAKREVTIKGIPAVVKQLQLYITNSEKTMESEKRIEVENGKARFTLESASYVTLINNQ